MYHTHIPVPTEGVRFPFRENRKNQVEVRGSDSFPSKEFFEKYGIGEASSLLTRDGATLAREVRGTTEIYTREKGFVSTFKILRRTLGHRKNAVEALLVRNRGLGDKLPVEDIVLGASANVRVLKSCAERQRPQEKEIRLENQAGFHLKDLRTSSSLFTLVFETPVTICVGGVYLTCPGREELIEEYRRSFFASSEPNPLYA